MGRPTGIPAEGALCLLALLITVSITYSSEVTTRHRQRTMEIVADTYANGLERTFADGVPSSASEAQHMAEKQVEQSKGGGHQGFGYGRDGPEVWGRLFPGCGGVNQSPVSLDTSTAKAVPRPQLFWWNYFLKPATMELINDGHTAKLYAKWRKPTEIPFLWASPDGPHFIFDHLHFHWGPDDGSGSEHTLNNNRFPLEMHAVHYRRDLMSLPGAAKTRGGLRVIGILFRISSRNNTGLEPITSVLNAVQSPGSRITVQPFALNTILPVFSKQYLTYNGSLTTPPCFESVLWVIRKEPLPISSYQVQQFRNIMNNEGSYNNRNFRPPQPLNGRDVQQVR